MGIVSIVRRQRVGDVPSNQKDVTNQNHPETEPRDQAAEPQAEQAGVVCSFHERADLSVCVSDWLAILGLNPRVAVVIPALYDESPHDDHRKAYEDEVPQRCGGERREELGGDIVRTHGLPRFSEGAIEPEDSRLKYYNTKSLKKQLKPQAEQI